MNVRLKPDATSRQTGGTVILLKRLMMVVCLLTAGVLDARAASVRNLQVEYRRTPLGIDVAAPRFSWQIDAAAGERAVSQAAYRIDVADSAGARVWESGKVEGDRSVHIVYAGSPLRAATRYTWTVTVWTRAGATLSGSSWFETGLMDPSPAAWSGAAWIGGADHDLVLYAHYLSVFDLSFTVAVAPGSARASFVYGANDRRMMDRFKNVFQLQRAKDESYIRLELDVSAVDAAPDGLARLNVYRVGYTPTDDPARPMKSFAIDRAVIHAGNAHAAHSVGVRSAFGTIALTIDGSTTFAGAPPPAAAPGGFGRGTAPNAVNLNPMGQGGDYLPFGLLCDIGFAVDPGQTATFSDVTVRHTRAPGHVLFREDLTAEPYKGIFTDAVKTNAGLSIAGGQYAVTGGASGVFVARDPSRNAMPMLRTTFATTAKPIRSARLYVTARGIYEIYLNGTRVGDDYYNPGLSQYDITHFYQTYDVTKSVGPGANVLGAMLGEGWWSGLLSFGSIWNHFGDRQSLLAKLVVTYADGTSDTVTTNDRTWKYFGRGPIVYSSLDAGEVYDATRDAAVAGWASAAYDDRQWTPAVVVPLAGTTFDALTFDRLSLVGQIGETAGVFRALSAKSVKEVRPGVFVYDLGQNIVGVPRISLANGRAGATITLRYAEMLYPDLPASGKNVGLIMTENYRAALSQDVYTMKAGPQVFQPRFTSHGFQYIEITGLDRALPLDAVQGVAISSVRALTAEYKTSSAKVNQLWSNLVWSNVDNFLTIPTDCPQRNERMGWSGDINVFARTATYVSNANQFLTRHMYAMRDVQAPSGRFADIAPVGGGFGGVLWGSAGIVVPWETYLQYGDRGLLERHYPAMVAYVAYLAGTVDPKSGLVGDAVLGDWLGPQNDALGSPYLANAYFAYNLGIMARVAGVLGKAEDAASYREQFERRKAHFNATFVNADKKTLATGSGGFGGPRRPSGAAPEFRLADTQTSYAVGLGMGVFNDDLVPQMVTNLADAVTRENKDDGGVVRPAYSLMTGFIGTSWISKALSQHGQSELAYRLLHNHTYPSWLYAIDQGATTIWERLNGYTVENGFGGNNSMNSFNHYSFGAVGQWMLAHSLGIEREAPGFKTFILQPEPDPTGVMTKAEGYYDSMYGRISSAWRVEGPTLTYTATVPANTTATLYLPTSSAESVKEGGRDLRFVAGVTFIRFERGKAVYALQSGSYVFTATR